MSIIVKIIYPPFKESLSLLENAKEVFTILFSLGFRNGSIIYLIIIVYKQKRAHAPILTAYH